MRSPTTPSPRRRPARPSHRDRLEAVARIVDAGSVGEPGHLAVHLHRTGTTDDVDLGLLPLPDGTHPFAELAGIHAPPSWSAFGLRVTGLATDVDRPHAPREAVATTFLVDRRGREVSLLRRGDDVDLLPGPAAGTIPDLCRRVLGLPTPDAPPSTAVLWTLAWLDRLLDAWGDPAQRRPLSASWAALAARHPAVEALGGSPPLDDPAALLPIARAHHAAWPWARLRAEPEVVGLPDGDLPTHVSTWMDDGFFARWCVGAFPPLHLLATDLPALLGEPCGSQLIATATALLD